jgi:hypothetical protein
VILYEDIIAMVSSISSKLWSIFKEGVRKWEGQGGQSLPQNPFLFSAVVLGKSTGRLPGVHTSGYIPGDL